ncbi:MAG: Ig-like domain-containing protein [Candidatus Gracilibacteria bacterium]
MKKVLPSIFLSWLVITSVLPTGYLQKIPLAKAASFTVDTTSDVNDSGDCATITAVNLPGTDVQISLREAICVANNTVGSDSVTFDAAISGGTITLLSPLPQITDTIVIDGGGDTKINGNSQTGIMLNASSSTIKGLELYGFTTTGNLLDILGDTNTIGGIGGTDRNYFWGNSQKFIAINGTSNVIVGNNIGVKTDNTASGANQFGISISGTGNVVGGSTTAERNVIADNDAAEISIGSGASGTVIKGNYIGIKPDGSAVLGASAIGIEILGTSNVTIGGSNAGEGNVISGHSSLGISQENSSNGVYIYGNYVGTNAAGSAAIANGIGIRTNGTPSNVVIGGNAAGQMNVVSGNTNEGIFIQGGSGTTVKGNYIGTKADGSLSIPNAKGIVVGNNPTNTIIGGNTAGDGNVISGNTNWGIEIQSSTTVKGNKIGTNPAGNIAIPNGQGIIFQNFGSTAVIGENSANGRNIISGNSTHGINITGNVTGVVPNITVSGNYIGTTADGTLDLGNGQNGIRIDTSSSNPTITIGDASSATATNVVSGNDWSGIYASAKCNIYSSYIGTNEAGTGAIANSIHGIDLEGFMINIGNSSLTTGFNVISGNGNRGIYVGSNTKNDTVSGNYIGTSFDGTSAIPNTSDGIFIENAIGLNIIGKDSSASITNVISGNTNNGIKTSGVEDVAIYSTIIGTNATGTAALANGSNGINISESGFTIGNNNLTTGFNVISGNSGTGVAISGTSASGSISGNIIGLDLTGSSKISNGWAGIYIKGASTSFVKIGDQTSAIATNVISGNKGGIAIQDTNNVGIFSSLIGSDKAETAATNVGNAGAGIRIVNSSSLTIGNTRTTGWNVITNSNGAGIRIESGNNSTINGNFISTDRTMAYDLGNSFEGILIDNGVTGTIIGGVTTGEGNVIKNSDSFGISTGAGPVDLIRGNLVYQNGTPSKPITITTPGAWNTSTLIFTTNTTSKVAGTITGFADGTTVDIYSGTDGTNPALMNYEGNTTITSGAFELNADFAALPGSYFYATIVDISTKKTSEASGPSGVITQDSTPPADITVTSSTSPTAIAAYTFTGTKEAYANVENDGSVWTGKTDSSTTWTKAVTLVEGANIFNLCSEDYSFNRSGTGTYTITMDTVNPAAPTLSYGSPASAATTTIAVSGEVGTSIFVNGVNSGSSIGGTGTTSVTVSVTANVSNTYIITLKDSALNTSPSTTATIVGGEPIVYAGGGGSSSSSTTTEDSSTTEETDEIVIPIEEDEGTDELAGEEETGDEDFSEIPVEEEIPQIEIPIEETETVPATETIQTPVVIINPSPTVTEEKIDENTFIITYEEPLSGEENIGTQGKIVEITISEDTVPVQTSVTSILTSSTASTESFVENLSNIADEKDIEINVEKVLTQITEDNNTDGVPDVWTLKYLGDEDFDMDSDTDNDGLTNAEEYTYGSNPTVNDTDGDGLSDYIEIKGLNTNPNSWDTDGDGLSDAKEVFTETSPTQKDIKEEDIDTTEYPEDKDTDGDGISDYIEIQNGTNPEVKDSDGDGLSDGQEWEYDTNPNSVSQTDEIKTKITNLKEGDTFSSSKTLLRGTSEPNTNVLITILDQNGNPVSIAETEVDANGKFAAEIEDDLQDGEYEIFLVETDESGNAKDISAISKFKVDSTQSTSEITVSELDAETAETKPQIKGYADPGTTIYATWKSFIFSSVLMADSETGEFIVQAPEDLETGDHKIYFYPVDSETGIKGEVMMVNFTVTGENLANESTSIPGENSSNTKYLPLLLLPILGLGALYIFYKKSKEQKHEEKSLIDKLENGNK